MNDRTRTMEETFHHLSLSLASGMGCGYRNRVLMTTMQLFPKRVARARALYLPVILNRKMSSTSVSSCPTSILESYWKRFDCKCGQVLLTFLYRTRAGNN